MSGSPESESNPTPALELIDITKRFGGLTSLDALSLAVAPSEILSVIGPNGAGKTTFFNVITGVYTPDEGDVLLFGESIRGVDPHKVARRGVARTFQNVRLFQNLTVRENITAAMYGRTNASLFDIVFRTPRARREERENEERVLDALSFFGTRLQGYRLDQPAYSLSYANRRRLEVARAMATGASVLLLDEPAAGMNPKETQEITEIIGRLRDERSYTIVVIEHDMHVVEGVSDRVIALDHGVKIAEGSFEDVATHPAVIEAYLGRGSAARK
ncbi:MAG: ATP-binding cassette domain-containing protein [Actinobacteria bacterium]|nr:ATP-binding cassette domain-containing protein [Actinomycetota bacterium]